MIRYLDSHCHITCERLYPRVEEILENCRTSQVDRLLVICCTYEELQRALDLKQRHPHLQIAYGFYPCDTYTLNEADYTRLEDVCRSGCIDVIGEIGLDYYWEENPPRQFQREVFARQLALAEKLDLPVIVHDREAHGDCLDMVRAFPNVRGVFHCYSGSVEDARVLLDRGWYLGFDGPITYKNARKAPEVVQYMPMDRMLLETDSPYLAPVPFRGKRNDSRYLSYVAERIAQLRGMDAAAVEQATWDNANRFFGLQG